MPYIRHEQRPDIDRAVNELPHGMTAGQKNYAITKMIDRDLWQQAVTYDNINEWIGVLECVKLELYRRQAVPYEDRKIRANGDAYDTRA